ncbi:chymotrypsin-1 [Pieris rapae]|uniref:chymotrypsin-1 n=1 Tax=Pieris rapae TaxID=64459 RepID=UPI001E27C4BC|nr:chymotrypsin-1 [Pieris rapae]
MHTRYLFFFLWVVLGDAKPDIEGRVVGGKDAAKGSAPYQVSIRLGYVEGAPKKHFCGGSVLNDKWILSAAHCTYHVPIGILTAVVGTMKLSSGGDSYEIETIENHPDYDPKTIKHDISLLKVRGTIKFSDNVQAIELPTSDTGVGEVCTVTGWGDTDNQNTVPDNLQALDLKTISKEKCNKELAPAREYLPIEDNQLCTFNKAREGICGGDSGGPLVKDKKQVGIVSWGAPCAVGVPDVFTRVYSYVDWIKKKIEN